MACKRCDLKRIYKLFEEKKMREAEAAKMAAQALEIEKKKEEEKALREKEEAAKRARKKKEPEFVEPVINVKSEGEEEI